MLLCLIFTVACVKQVEFSSEDSHVKELITIIERYTFDKGRAPEDLEDLIPDYVSAIRSPKWASSVSYQYDEKTDSWLLHYYLQDGGEAIYHSQDGWLVDSFPR